MNARNLLLLGLGAAAVVVGLGLIYLPYLPGSATAIIAAHFLALLGAAVAVFLPFGFRVRFSLMPEKSRIVLIVVEWLLAMAAFVSLVLLAMTYTVISYTTFWTVELILYALVVLAAAAESAVGRSSLVREANAAVVSARKKSLSDELLDLAARYAKLDGEAPRQTVNMLRKFAEELRYLPSQSTAGDAGGQFARVRAWMQQANECLAACAGQADATADNARFTELSIESDSLLRSLARGDR